MKCPFCGHQEDRVLDSRTAKDGEVIRRRRQCEGCTKRFTTYERVEEIPYMVIKKDGRREAFDRQKLISGIGKACERRPVSPVDMEAIADHAETLLLSIPEREVATKQLGDFVLKELFTLDGIAYIRFASVNLPYDNLHEMMAVIQEILSQTKDTKS